MCSCVIVDVCQDGRHSFSWGILSVRGGGCEGRGGLDDFCRGLGFGWDGVNAPGRVGG
jgi:hypothetical protein